MRRGIHQVLDRKLLMKYMNTSVLMMLRHMALALVQYVHIIFLLFFAIFTPHALHS